MPVNWPPRTIGEPLDGYGPLRDQITLVIGKRVKYTQPRTGETNTGTISGWGRPFNGIAGIRVCVDVALDGPGEWVGGCFADLLAECDQYEAAALTAQASGAVYAEVPLF